jgi:hypothetical protein
VTDAKGTYDSARTLILVLLVAGILAAIGLGLFVAGHRSVSERPPAALRSPPSSPAAGELARMSSELQSLVQRFRY